MQIETAEESTFKFSSKLAITRHCFYLLLRHRDFILLLKSFSVSSPFVSSFFTAGANTASRAFWALHNFFAFTFASFKRTMTRVPSPGIQVRNTIVLQYRYIQCVHNSPYVKL